MTPKLSHLLLVSLLLAPVAREASAQETTGGTPPPASGAGNRDARRLFQRFAEDPAIVAGGWIEGQFNFSDAGHGDSQWSISSLLAFRVNDQIEAGLQLGYLDVNADPGPDGSGLSDIDVYAKYRFHGSAGRCAAGGLIKIPTGKEEDGLGTGKLDVEGFYACRADLQSVTVVGNLGARYNGDPNPPLPDAKASLLAGGALLLPVGPQQTFVIEATYESERLDGAGSDARLTLGYQGIAKSPGFGFRGAGVIALSEGAPDFQLLFGAVYLF